MRETFTSSLVYILASPAGFPSPTIPYSAIWSRNLDEIFRVSLSGDTALNPPLRKLQLSKVLLIAENIVTNNGRKQCPLVDLSFQTRCSILSHVQIMQEKNTNDHRLCRTVRETIFYARINAPGDTLKIRKN